MALRILRLPDVQAITGLGRSAIYEKEARGEFPQRVRLSARACGWYQHEIEQWLESLPRGKDADADTGELMRRRGRSDCAA